MHRKLLWRSSPLRHISAVVSDVGTPSTSLITISSLPANTSAASSATTPAPDAVFEGDEYSIHRRRKEWRLRGLPPYLVSHSAALSAIFPRGEVAAKDVVRLLSINGQAVEEIPAKAIRESMLPDQRYTIVVSLERPQPQQQQQQQQDDDNENAEHKTTVVAKKVGRGRKKMVQTLEEHTTDAHVESAAPTPKRRGRPAGSCNKNKMLAAPPVEPVEVDEKHTTLKINKVGRVRRRRTATVVMDDDAATPSSSSTSATLPLDDAVAAVLQSFQTSQTAAETTTTTTTTLGSTELRRKRGRKPAATKEVAKSEDVDGINLQHEQPSSSSIPLPTKVKAAGKRAGRRTLPRDGESLAF